MHGRKRKQKAGKRSPERIRGKCSGSDKVKAETEIEGRTSERMWKSEKLVTADSRAGEEMSRETHKDDDVRKDGEAKMGVSAESEATR